MPTPDPQASPEAPAPTRPIFRTLDDYRDAPMADYPRTSKLFQGLIVGICGTFTKLVWPWSFQDGAKLWKKPAPGESGRVIIMNHTSMMEPVALYVTLYTHGIRPRFVYKSEFDGVAKVFSFLLSRMGCIPVERGTADLKCLRRAEKALKRGEFVCIYPEGTRIRTDDQPVEIHGGFALMAQMGKASVQPTAVVGARDITPAGTHLKRLFWRVFLKAGDPISFDDVGGKKRKEKCANMEAAAMQQVYALRDELRASHSRKH